MDDYYDNFYKYLSEAIYEIFTDEFNKSKQIQSTYNYLQNFQIILEQMPLWNTPTCEKKWEFICRHAGNDYLEEYMKIVIYTKMKFVIDSCFDEEKEINELVNQFRCPTKEEFLREVLTSCARNFYENPYLFKENRNIQARIDNSMKIKSIINENIKFVIQKYLPSKSIIRKCKPENILKKKKVVTSTVGLQCELQVPDKQAHSSSECHGSNMTEPSELDIDLRSDSDNTFKNTTENISNKINNLTNQAYNNVNTVSVSSPDVIINPNHMSTESFSTQPTTDAAMQNLDYFKKKENENIKNYNELQKEYIDNQNPTNNENIATQEKNNNEVITVTVPNHFINKGQFQSPIASNLVKSRSKTSSTSSNSSSSSTSTSTSTSSSSSTSSKSKRADDHKSSRKNKNKTEKIKDLDKKNRNGQRDLEETTNTPSSNNHSFTSKSKSSSTDENSSSYFEQEYIKNKYKKKKSNHKNNITKKKANKFKKISKEKETNKKNHKKSYDTSESRESESSNENSSFYDKYNSRSTQSDIDKSSSYKEFTRTIENELNSRKKKPLFSFK